MKGEELRDGKARVQEVLIKPLEQRGMVRPRGMTLEAYAGWKERLAARLAYMSREALEALAETCEMNAGGKARNVWPAEMTILHWARLLEPPPASDSRLLVTFLRSAAGKRAVEAGHAVELYRWLKQNGRPPGVWAMDQIRDAAAERARRMARVDQAIAAGTADEGMLAWKAAWERDLGRVREIIGADGRDRAA